LPETAITLDDRIDDFATLHTASCGKIQLAGAVEYVHTEVVHHESAAPGAD
jgi:hypothetical protein